MPIKYSDTRLENRNQEINQIVDFEYPDKSYFGTSSEYFIVWNLAYQTVLVKVLVYGKLHEVVVKGNQDLHR